MPAVCNGGGGDDRSLMRNTPLTTGQVSMVVPMKRLLEVTFLLSVKGMVCTDVFHNWNSSLAVAFVDTCWEEVEDTLHGVSVLQLSLDLAA